MKRSHIGKCFWAVAVLAFSASLHLSLVFAQDNSPDVGNKAPLPPGPLDRAPRLCSLRLRSGQAGQARDRRGSDSVFAQADSPASTSPSAPSSGSARSLADEAPGVPPEVVARRFRLEASSFDNMVSNGFGHWWGGGVGLSWRASDRVTAFGNIYSQHRPGETQQLAEFRTLVNWSKWFYTDMAVSGGGPDESSAFFPRIRYDLTANVKLPQLPGFIFTGGLTRLYFGSPNNGRILRVGAIYYWRHFVFQGNLNFNNARPGNRKSKSANGAVQYGQERHYWVGLVAGGGREAWQTLALTPQDVQFTSYSASTFLRKWLAPSYGVAFSYSYALKHTAYRINGLEMKFFLDF